MPWKEATFAALRVCNVSGRSVHLRCMTARLVVVPAGQEAYSGGRRAVLVLIPADQATCLMGMEV
jgi:hypothetical protein